MNPKNQQLVAYLTQNHPEASVTVLVKLCYLVDLVSTKRYGKQVSSFEYIRYHYGPFDQKIYEVLESLIDSKFITMTTEYTKKGAEAIIYHFSDSSDFKISNLTPEDITIVDEIIESVRGYGAKILTEITYKTKPMKALNATLGGTEGMYQKLNLATE